MSAQTQLQHIQHLAQQGQLNQAVKLSEQLLTAFPNEAAAWINHSMLLFQTGQHQLVNQAIEQALEISPNHLPYRIHQVMAAEAVGEVTAAIEFAKTTAKLPLQSLDVIDTLAAFFNKHQQYTEAKKLYQQAIKLKPQDTRMLFNLAMTEQYLGDLDAAEQAANQALELDPENCDLHFFRSHLNKQSPEHNHIEALQQTLKHPPGNPTQHAKACFSLAKELEDCKQYTASFTARAEGAKIYRNSLQYNVQSDLDFMQAIEDAYSSDFLHHKPDGYENQEPIFVVGLPRSGTTLLERIIGSHSDVVSAGELTNFNRCMLSGIQSLSLNPQLSRSQMVAASVHMDFQALGQNYLQSTRPISGKTAHFIDKFPQNAQYIGLIHRALPQAKILILERHPLDVCYAVYKQMFTDIYQFSYDLDELAQYFIQHQKLMQHWQSNLPNQVKTVRYEDLVSDLESAAKQVIDFCGLDWQPACVNFHQNQQASTTASASQVRQKIYSSSVGLWKNYAQQLHPLIKRLNEAKVFETWDWFIAKKQAGYNPTCL